MLQVSAPNAGRGEMMENFQVMRFAMVDFEGKWDSNVIPAGSNVIRYEAQSEGRIAVAFEGATGVFHTYRYRVKPKDIVYVFNDVIHIPARFYEDEPGNTIR